MGGSLFTEVAFCDPEADHPTLVLPAPTGHRDRQVNNLVPPSRPPPLCYARWAEVERPLSFLLLLGVFFPCPMMYSTTYWLRDLGCDLR